MLVVMTVRTVLKVPFEKAAPPCPFDVPAPLLIPPGKFSLRPWPKGQTSNQIQSLIILAVIRRNLKRVCGAHLLVIAPSQHRSFRKSIAAVASRR